MSETKMSAIEEALAKARARKAAKEAAGLLPESPVVAAPKKAAAKENKPTKEQTNPDRAAEKANERAAKQAQLEADREVRRQAREARKAEKAATKAAAAPRSAHMKKVENARAKLMSLNSEAELIYNEIVANYSGMMVNAIAEHLKLYVRMSSTQRAQSGAAFKIGAKVTITGGDPKHIGKVGTVTKSQKLRTFVDVGERKEVYIFTTDAKLTAEETLAVAV
jgi:hypothetical protein